MKYICELIENAGIEGHSMDLITFMECLHDIPDPVQVLKAARSLMKPGGTVMIVEERIEDKLTDMLPRDPTSVGLYSENIENFMARLNYSFSTLHCLPCSMAQPNSKAVGTAIRPAWIKAAALEAGFSSCEVTHCADFFKIYQIK